MRYGLETAHDGCEECAWCASQALTAIRHSVADTATTFAAGTDCYGAAFRETDESYAALWAKIN